VVHCAEEVARKILDTYLEPDKNFVELREMAIDGTIDLLRGFSDACHDEFEKLRPIQFLSFTRIVSLASAFATSFSRMPALAASHQMHWP
jgi:hypothetical protein